MAMTRMAGNRGAVLAAGLLALALGACAQDGADRNTFIPERAGLYAVTGGGDVLRLDGTRLWEAESWDERSTLDRHTRFVVRDRGLRMVGDDLGEAVALYRVAWVRSRIGPDGNAMPVVGRQWSVPQDESFRVAVDLFRVRGQDDVVRVVPREPLESGLYSLRVATGEDWRHGRLGVNWASLDRDRYATANCVDEYVNAAGGRSGFGLCAERAPFGSRGLRVFLATPRVEMVNGGDRLIVPGVVVNMSGQDKSVPTMIAKVRGANGEVIRQTTVKATPSALQPDDIASFEIGLDDPPADARSVDVEFPAEAPAAGR